MNPALTSNTLWDTYQALPTEEQQDILAILEKKATPFHWRINPTYEW